MNNTSAYANVLLKQSVAAPFVATPKRDYQDDFSSADFNQTLKDVHASQQGQNEKACASASHKKTAQAERHSDAKNTKDIKDIKSSHETARRQKSADNYADINQNSVSNEVVREQPKQDKNEDLRADKATEATTAQDVNNLVADISREVSQDALIASTAVNGADIGVTQAALVFGTELMPTSEALVVDVSAIDDKSIPTQENSLFADINAASVSIEDSGAALSPLVTKPAAMTALDVAHIAPSTIMPKVIDAATPALPLSGTSESVTTLDIVTVAPIESNAIPLETVNLANVSLSPAASGKVDKSSEVPSRPLVDDPLSRQNLSQQLVDSPQVIAVNQSSDFAAPVDSQVFTAGGMVSGASVKPSQAQVVLAEMSEVSDEIIDLLTPSVTEISVSVKAAPVSNLGVNTATNPEVATAQVQMNASKAAFEKTLQTIVTPDAGGVDDATAESVPNSSGASTATNPLMDSLMRGADQQTPAARNFVVQTTVPVPVGQPQWSQAVGEKVLWLAAQNVSSAEINLHPKDLGPIQVRVSVNQEQTTVNFTSHHAVVREVLDQNLNRLRDMFSEQGLNLVNVDVSDKSFSRQQGDAQNQRGRGGSPDVASDEEAMIAMSTIVQQRLVDHYA